MKKPTKKTVKKATNVRRTHGGPVVRQKRLAAWKVQVETGLPLAPTCQPLKVGEFRDHYMQGRGIFVAPSGRVYYVACGETGNQPGGQSHEAFAEELLKRKGETPSQEAKEMSQASGYDMGENECELIRRGWVRGRSCAFTAYYDKNRVKDAAWNAWIGAKIYGDCDDRNGLVLEFLNPHVGMHGSMPFSGADDLASRLESSSLRGLCRKGRRTRRRDGR